ncbi:hypothetical protein ACFLRN_10670, partial [Thermoproteota archaeon]
PNWKQNGKPFQVNKEIQKKFVDRLKPISAPQKAVIRKPLLLRILEKFAPPTTHSETVKVTNWNDKEQESWEAEEENDWNEFLTTEEEWQ